MSEQLGKIERPPAEEYKMGRKLFLVPLVFAPQELADLTEIVSRYWEQVKVQVARLEARLGEVNKIYHELIPSGGEQGVRAIEELNKESYQIAQSRLDKGCEFQPIEDAELLTEFMDWSRCLSMGLQNHKVFSKVYESFVAAQKRRNEYIAKQIDGTLKDNEIGILLIREGHQVQFPPDIQVFYVAPPALDELRRWLMAREQKAETQA